MCVWKAFSTFALERTRIRRLSDDGGVVTMASAVVAEVEAAWLQRLLPFVRSPDHTMATTTTMAAEAAAVHPVRLG